MPHVVVVGAGISGLVAARMLSRRGLDVRVLEATPRVGGALRTDEVGGIPIDVGAEAFHTAAPEPLELIGELGLSDHLVEAASGPTWIWTGRRLRALPAGVGPMGPTRLGPLVRSRLLSPAGLLRAGLEPLVGWRPPAGDVDVGTAIAARFGTQVLDRLVDPLLGSLHAGDLGAPSLRSATPQLAATLDAGGSLLLAARRNRRRRGPGGGGGSVALRGGTARLTDALAASLQGSVSIGARVTGIARHGAVFRLVTDDEEVVADAVVLAVPAVAAASMLAGPLPSAAAGLQRLRAADVATVVLGYQGVTSGEPPALGGTGLLCPSRGGRLLKAAIFLSTKWPHLRGGDRFLVRASAGRAGDARIHGLSDEELAGRLHTELTQAVGPLPQPDAVHVVRWPAAMPQLEVGHRDRLAAVRGSLPDRFLLAGAPYDGVGVAAAIRSGRTAAIQLEEQLVEVRT